MKNEQPIIQEIDISDREYEKQLFDQTLKKIDDQKDLIQANFTKAFQNPKEAQITFESIDKERAKILLITKPELFGDLNGRVILGIKTKERKEAIQSLDKIISTHNEIELIKEYHNRQIDMFYFHIARDDAMKFITKSNPYQNPNYERDLRGM